MPEIDVKIEQNQLREAGCAHWALLLRFDHISFQKISEMLLFFIERNTSGYGYLFVGQCLLTYVEYANCRRSAIASQFLKNKLTSLKATLIRNYDPQTDAKS